MLTPFFGVVPLDGTIVVFGAVITVLGGATTGHWIEIALTAAAPRTMEHWPVGLGPLLGLAAGCATVARWLA